MAAAGVQQYGVECRIESTASSTASSAASSAARRSTAETAAESTAAIPTGWSKRVTSTRHRIRTRLTPNFQQPAVPAFATTGAVTTTAASAAARDTAAILPLPPPPSLASSTSSFSIISREHYLRSNLSCGLSCCATCPAPFRVLQHSDVDCYLIPDADTIINFLQVLELPDVQNIVFLSSVIQEVRSRHPPGSVGRRIRALISDPRRGHSLFHDLHHIATSQHSLQTRLPSLIPSSLSSSTAISSSASSSNSKSLHFSFSNSTFSSSSSSFPTASPSFGLPAGPLTKQSAALLATADWLHRHVGGRASFVLLTSSVAAAEAGNLSLKARSLASSLKTNEGNTSMQNEASEETKQEAGRLLLGGLGSDGEQQGAAEGTGGADLTGGDDAEGGRGAAGEGWGETKDNLAWRGKSDDLAWRGKNDESAWLGMDGASTTGLEAGGIEMPPLQFLTRGREEEWRGGKSWREEGAGRSGGVKIMSPDEYFSDHSAHSSQVLSLFDALSAAAASKAHLSREPQERRSKRAIYAAHFSSASLEDGLQNGDLLLGVLRFVPSNRRPGEAETMVEVTSGSGQRIEVFIPDRIHQNRAFVGDTVAVRLISGQTLEKDGEKEEERRGEGGGKGEKVKRGVGMEADVGGKLGGAAHNAEYERGVARERGKEGKSCGRGGDDGGDEEEGRRHYSDDDDDDAYDERGGGKREDDDEFENEEEDILWPDLGELGGVEEGEEGSVDSEAEGWELEEREEGKGGGERAKVVGEVVAIVERAKREFSVCLLSDVRPRRDGETAEEEPNMEASRHPAMLLCVPLDPHLPLLRLRTRQWRQLRGNRFVVQLTSWDMTSSLPNVHLIRVLGPIGERHVDEQALLSERQLGDVAFSRGSLNELPDEAWQIPATEIERRRDLRDAHFACSIDPEGCRDIDDVLSVGWRSDGRLEVGVHIADVAFFVQPGSCLDADARQRGCTMYLPQKQRPMLPPDLSESLCSLRSGEDRLAVSVIWTVDPRQNYRIAATWFGRTVVRSKMQLSYHQAQHILDGHHSSSLLLTWQAEHGQAALAETRRNLAVLSIFAQLSRAHRESRGALEFAGADLKFEFDETTNEPTGITRERANTVHTIVAELMIRANAAVAERIFRSFPHSALLLRQLPPPPHAFRDLAKLCSSRGIHLDASSSKSLASSLRRVADKNDPLLEMAVRILARKSLSAAATHDGYVTCSNLSAANPAASRLLLSRSDSSLGWLEDDEQLVGHFSLGLRFYTHFTSPIRRYADVVVHRMLLAALEKDEEDDASTEEEDKIQSGSMQRHLGLIEEGLEQLVSQINLKAKAVAAAEKEASRKCLHRLLLGQPVVEKAYVVDLHSDAVSLFSPTLDILATAPLQDENGVVLPPAFFESAAEEEERRAELRGRLQVEEVEKRAVLVIRDVWDGSVVSHFTPLCPVWVEFSAHQRSRAHLPSLRIRLLHPNHPAAEAGEKRQRGEGGEEEEEEEEGSRLVHEESHAERAQQQEWSFPGSQRTAARQQQQQQHQQQQGWDEKAIAAAFGSSADFNDGFDAKLWEPAESSGWEEAPGDWMHKDVVWDNDVAPTPDDVAGGDDDVAGDSHGEMAVGDCAVDDVAEETIFGVLEHFKRLRAQEEEGVSVTKSPNGPSTVYLPSATRSYRMSKIRVQAASLYARRCSSFLSEKHPLQQRRVAKEKATRFSEGRQLQRFS